VNTQHALRIGSAEVLSVRSSTTTTTVHLPRCHCSQPLSVRSVPGGCQQLPCEVDVLTLRSLPGLSLGLEPHTEAGVDGNVLGCAVKRLS